MASRNGDSGPIRGDLPRTERPSAKRRTRADPPVRDPTRYSLTDHFLERLGQPGRYASTELVSEAIRRGQLRWNDTEGWRFALVEEGVRVVVVVEDTETASPVVVTAWTEVADRDRAVTSRRWGPADVHTIRLRTALSADANSHVPDEIRPCDVDRPFVVGNHRISTRPGDGFVVCADCNRRFRSKARLRNRPCRD